jgi:hypothetical protein
VTRRLTWFVGGAVTGATGTAYAARKLKRTARQLAPANVARQTVEGVRRRGRTVAAAIREGRDAMRHREDELKARRDGRLEHLADHLAPGDQVLVDGRPVESGRVIVLRQKHS